MNSEHIKALKNVHKARSEIYSFLDKFFRLLPDDEFYNMIGQNLPYLKDIAESSGNKDMMEGIKGVNDFFVKMADLKDEEREEYLLEALRRYTSLFCLTDSVLMVESYYTSPEKLVMQEARDEVLKAMRKYGFQRSEAVTEYDDHLSVEMAFIGKLAAFSADALGENNIESYNQLIKDQLAFHTEHFDRWVGAFVDDVLSFPMDERLFKPMSMFVRGYIGEDKQLLSDIKDETLV